MWPYWLFFFILALAAINGRQRAPSLHTGVHSIRLDAIWILTIVFFTLVIGYRVEVGGDWGSYLSYLFRVERSSFTDVLAMGDPGYQVLNWLSAQMDWGIWGVNIFSGFIFTTGLVIFSRSLPRPWLAMAVSVPYMLTVVAMGYSRQGVALGFAMLGLVALGRKQNLWFVFWVFLAATCHKSAVLLFPIAALASTHNKYWTAMWVSVVALGSYYLLLQDAVDNLYTNYVEAEYQSQGAFIRLAMNAVPASILLLLRKRFNFSPAEKLLWLWFAIISLGLMAILLMTPATTAVDRIALYMLPLQLVVFSHIPDVLGGRKTASSYVMAVLAYYGLVHFVWLNFATHAYAWLPYRNYLFE